ncbi:MAG: ankyrin [uncultured bacterium]|nr:MAG: ankyrin [uncultured bacterium]KKP28495.1 MAG: hypothetical protein UR12_C0018G0018 [candidate division TM6 bacterium GW2011_GWF2_30_66]
MSKSLKVFNTKVLLVLCLGLFCLQEKVFASINNSSKNNNIYLFRAAKNGDLAWVKKLVEKKNADVNYKTSSGKTVLIKAATSKSKKVVNYLLLLKDKDNKKIVNFNCVDNNGQTAMHKAAKNDDYVIVKMLVKVGADKNKQDRWGNTALHIASKKGLTEVVKELLENGNEYDNLEIKNSNGDTPLQQAVRANYKSVVELLLKNGAKINTINKNGKMPIDYAKGEVKKLLSKKV